MAKPWQTLATVPTAEGPLELRQRGERDFLIVVGGRVLMTSVARRSEEALATFAAAAMKGRISHPRVLIGGLGMAYTVRAALDAFGPGARVTVAELTPAVIDWCKGPLAPLTAGAALDRRVDIVIEDVARVIANGRATYDAILLDLYEGPNPATQRKDDPFYGPAALARSHAALRPGGVLAIWAEDPDPGFPRRFGLAGFDVTTHRAGKGGRAHIVYLGVRAEPADARRPGPSRTPRPPGPPPPRPPRTSPTRTSPTRTSPTRTPRSR
jgi:predicted membrane-bound spermidine synthase